MEEIAQDGVMTADDPPSNTGESGGQPNVEGEGKPFDQKAANIAFIREKKNNEANVLALRQELEAEKAKTAEKNSDNVLIDVPPILDPLDDDDADRKNRERDAIIAKNATIQATNAANAKAKQDMLAQQQYDAEIQSKKDVAKYGERASSHGISHIETMEHAQTLQLYNLDPALQNHIVVTPKGPLISKYLHENQLELDEISRMGPVEAGEYIATKVMPKLKIKPPDNSNVPPPLNNPGSPSSIPEGSDPLLDGATFESFKG